jgi:uncharacterized protein with HEPN domain
MRQSVPHKDRLLRVADMLQAAHKIEQYVDGMTYDEFEVDERTADAVIRNLGIVGEAANHVPEDIQKEHSNIAWSQIRGMRNVVIHEYSGIELRVIWDTVQQHLPQLIIHLQHILDTESLEGLN